MRVVLYGCCIDVPSSVQLPLPLAYGDAEPVLRVELGSVESSSHSYELDAMVSLSVAPGVVGVEPLEPLGPHALDHYLIDHAVPTGLSCDGHIIVHSACLELEGQAVVLVGASGAGKSTLSMQLVEAGWKLLGDDSVRLEPQKIGVTAWASYPGLRLNTDVLTAEETESSQPVAEYGSKRRLFPSATEGVASSRAVLVVELGEDRQLSTTPIGPAKRAAVLASQFFLPPATPAEGFARLDRATETAAALGGVRLDYPRTSAGGRQAVTKLGELLGAREAEGVAWPDLS